MFVARVVNKIHNINTVYLQKSKYMRVIQSKFTKTNPYFFSKWGGGGQRAGPGSAFAHDLTTPSAHIISIFKISACVNVVLL